MNRRQERYYSVAPHVDITTWITWEMKRHVDATETPGKYGTYGEEVAA